MGYIKNKMKKIFWKLPLPGTLKENLRVIYAERKFQKEENEAEDIYCTDNPEILKEYAKYVLSLPDHISDYHKKYEEHVNTDNKSIIVAYYLTQYSPNPHNDLEYPSYGKLVHVMRDTTEGPEGVAAGTSKLVGTNEETIYQKFKELLESQESYNKMTQAVNPYEDGNACKRIVDILEKDLYDPGMA